MSIILFLIVLAVLIIVHEFGHFIVAKKAGVRVDEFGLGFPPRLIGWRPRGSETEYTLNLLPLGGFVKIFGEDPAEEGVADGPDKARSMPAKSPLTQIAILAAGVVGNVIIAYVFIWVSLVMGVPALVDDTLRDDAQVIITDVLHTGPAHEVLAVGDIIHAVNGIPTVHVADVQQAIAMSGGNEVTLLVERNQVDTPVTLTPEQGVTDTGTYAVGIALGAIAIEEYSTIPALGYAAVRTYEMIGGVALGLGGFLGDLVTGSANFSQVTGPVGLVGMVSNASEIGLVPLLTFAAVISINLALINLVPFPALDGGRILFVLIEVISQRKIPATVAQYVNAAGFLLLLILMGVVTYHDIIRIVAG